MLRNIPHLNRHLQEDDSSGILQSLHSPAVEPPSPNTLDKRFVFPLEKFPRNTSYPLSMPTNESYNAMTRVAAPIERLPVEIFGMLWQYPLLGCFGFRADQAASQTKSSHTSPLRPPQMAMRLATETLRRAFLCPARSTI